jgi:hypothetical protein
MPPTLYIAVALLVVVVTRQFAPIAASGLGLAVAAGIGVWGALTYAHGGGMTFLGQRIAPTVFFGFVALLLVFEAMNLHRSLKRRQQARAADQT